MAMELANEEDNERSETGAFSELKTSLAFPRQVMPTLNIYGGEGEEGKKPPSRSRSSTLPRLEVYASLSLD